MRGLPFSGLFKTLRHQDDVEIGAPWVPADGRHFATGTADGRVHASKTPAPPRVMMQYVLFTSFPLRHLRLAAAGSL